MNNGYDKTLIYNPQNSENLQRVCTECLHFIDNDAAFCPYCGRKVDAKNSAFYDEKGYNSPFATASSYGTTYNGSEDLILERIVKAELGKHQYDKNLTTRDINRRNNLFNLLLSILVFVFISLIFFHFPIYTYIIGFIILVLLKVFTKKRTLEAYLVKEIKSRPQEKISNIVANTVNTLEKSSTLGFQLVTLIIAIILPLIIFMTPKIIYEKIEGGYAVRYYIYGLTNMTKVDIPSEHKGQPVVSIRGNGFSNMPLLVEANLPDTITEIRGQAFTNDSSLKKVHLPSKLTYLGGGAFANCTSLEEIELPDTITYLGGESFKGAKRLRSITLPSKLEEIRGNTFEECVSLEEIFIPDTVTRIGGHAFYGDKSLSKVTISSKSMLEEIGSSAFRRCDSLQSITLPYGVDVNERAFKESPTDVEYYQEIVYTDNDLKSMYAHSEKKTFFEGDTHTITIDGSEVEITMTYISKILDYYAFSIHGNTLYRYETLDESHKGCRISTYLYLLMTNHTEDSVDVTIYYN